MAWLKLDDQFHAHPKLAQLGESLLECLGLWTLALSWCGNYLTDGEIPAGQVTRFGGSPRLADALVESGLWERTERGFRFHDYLDFNPAGAEVKADRKAKHEAKAKAGRAGGLRSAANRRNTNEATEDPASGRNEASELRDLIGSSPSSNQRPSSSDPHSDRAESRQVV